MYLQSPYGPGSGPPPQITRHRFGHQSGLDASSGLNSETFRLRIAFPVYFGVSKNKHNHVPSDTLRTWKWSPTRNIMHINNDMNINIHIIINMNIEDYKRYYLLFIRYSLLGIPYWVFPIGYSLLAIPRSTFCLPMGLHLGPHMWRCQTCGAARHAELSKRQA